MFNSAYGRFFQLGYVTYDIDAAVADFEQRMGAVRIDLIRDMRDGEGNPIFIDSLSHLSLPGVELEVIQPRVGWQTVYSEMMPAAGEVARLHHLGFAIEDEAQWQAARAGLDAAGTPIAVEGGTADVRSVYFDTRAATGHFSELVFRLNPEKLRPLPR